MGGDPLNDDGMIDPEFAAINVVGDILAVIDELDAIAARLYGYSEHKETAALLDDVADTARKIAAGVGRMTTKQPEGTTRCLAVLIADGYTCALCGQQAMWPAVISDGWSGEWPTDD